MGGDEFEERLVFEAFEVEDFLFEGGDLISKFADDLARNVICVGEFDLVGDFEIHDGELL